jgi:hypothetical protein
VVSTVRTGWDEPGQDLAVDRAQDQDHDRGDIGRRGDAAQPLPPAQVATEQVLPWADRGCPPGR